MPSLQMISYPVLTDIIAPIPSNHTTAIDPNALQGNGGILFCPFFYPTRKYTKPPVIKAKLAKGLIVVQIQPIGVADDPSGNSINDCDDQANRGKNHTDDG